MNSTLVKPFLLGKKLRKLRSLPKDSVERAEITEVLLIGVTKCLLENSDEPVEKLLSSRYVCPFQYRLHEDKNITKIADTVVMALVQPGIVQNFRFATSLAESTQKSLLDICKRSFGSYLKADFQRSSSNLSINFTAI